MATTVLPLLVFARILAVFVAFLVVLWALAFNSSFLPHSSASRQDLIYATLHPLFMVIGFILISGEAILVHRWLPGSRNFKKSVHLCLQAIALASGLFGIWTKFQSGDGFVANFFSLHSWMGLFCIFLFGVQFGLYEAVLGDVRHLRELMWLMGFLSFWHRGEIRRIRVRILPWHIFIGLYTYGLAVATAETGLLEKLTLLQSQAQGHTHPEFMVVNSIGLALAVLCGFVILAAVLPKYLNLQTKPVHSSDTRSRFSFN